MYKKGNESKERVRVNHNFAIVSVPGSGSRSGQKATRKKNLSQDRDIVEAALQLRQAGIKQEKAWKKARNENNMNTQNTGDVEMQATNTYDPNSNRVEIFDEMPQQSLEPSRRDGAQQDHDITTHEVEQISDHEQAEIADNVPTIPAQKNPLRIPSSSPPPSLRDKQKQSHAVLHKTIHAVPLVEETHSISKPLKPVIQAAPPVIEISHTPVPAISSSHPFGTMSQPKWQFLGTRLKNSQMVRSC